MAKQRNPKGAGNYRRLKDNRVAWRQTVDGETREISAKTPGELKNKIKEIADLPIIKGKHKVDEWFDKWLKIYIKPLKKTATYEQYKNLYIKHIKPEIGNRVLSKLKPYDMQHIIASMNTDGLSTWTMKHVRKILNISFTKAIQEKLIAENPVKNIEIPVKQAKPRKTLTLPELNKIFKKMKNSRWIWSVRFLLVTGLRRGELLALKWSDIDFKNSRILVDESNSQTSGVGDTKSAKEHYVPLSKAAIECLKQQKVMLANEFNQNKEFVFPAKKGHPMVPGAYYTMLARHAKAAGVKASPHCLRHTFVYLMRKKLSLKELQEILGHDESTTTLDIYGTMLNDSIDKTAVEIDEVFSQVDIELKKTERKSNHLRRVK